MIQITEVSPRDGLQNEKVLLTVDQRVKLIERIANSGITMIEAVSFVNPKVVPQMAGAEEVLKRVQRNGQVQYAGLVLSRSGLDRALETQLDAIHIAMAASDTFNFKNARRTVADSVKEITQMIGDIRSVDKSVSVYIGTAFGCPFEGDVPKTAVMDIAEQFIKAGCNRITLADTVGVANPIQVTDYVQEFHHRFQDNIPLGLHFHNTRGLGIVNVYAGYMAGVRYFDSSVGGLGGCPFAPKAVGNVCTEDLLNMFEESHINIDVDLDAVIETAHWLENTVGHKLDGMIMKAGRGKH